MKLRYSHIALNYFSIHVNQIQDVNFIDSREIQLNYETEVKACELNYCTFNSKIIVAQFTETKSCMTQGKYNLMIHSFIDFLSKKKLIPLYFSLSMCFYVDIEITDMENNTKLSSMSLTISDLFQAKYNYKTSI